MAKCDLDAMQGRYDAAELASEQKARGFPHDPYALGRSVADVPALIAEVRELRAARERVEALADNWGRRDYTSDETEPFARKIRAALRGPDA